MKYKSSGKEPKVILLAKRKLRMYIVKVTLAVFCFATLANALVSIPDEGLRPPKRPPPPSPPTLPPLPYAAAIPDVSAVPVIPVSRIVPVAPVIPVNRIFPAVPAAPVIPVPIPVNRIAPTLPLRVIPVPPSTVPSLRDSFNSPLSQPATSPVFRDEIKDQMGQFELRHSDGKGTLVNESGKLISTDDGWEYVIVKEGDYTFISPEGSPVKFHYVADEKGVKTSYSIRSQ